MKKLKTLGIITMAVLLVTMAAFAAMAALGIFKFETDETGKTEIIFSPSENKNEFLAWQTEETEGDTLAVFKTDAGVFTVKLAGDRYAIFVFWKKRKTPYLQFVKNIHIYMYKNMIQCR